MKQKKEQSLRTWLTPKLRRLSYQWAPRNQAKALARIERGKYKCAKCNNIFGPKEIVVDHINPVVAVDGFTNWEEYITSLFCDITNFQILCEECHSDKSQKENITRREIKDANKNK